MRSAGLDTMTERSFVQARPPAPQHWWAHVRAGRIKEEGPRMKRNLNCPCGETIVGTDEDDLVTKTKAHLAANHPGHDYSREEILFIAY